MSHRFSSGTDPSSASSSLVSSRQQSTELLLWLPLSLHTATSAGSFLPPCLGGCRPQQQPQEAPLRPDPLGLLLLACRSCSLARPRGPLKFTRCRTGLDQPRCSAMCVQDLILSVTVHNLWSQVKVRTKSGEGKGFSSWSLWSDTAAVSLWALQQNDGQFHHCCEGENHGVTYQGKARLLWSWLRSRHAWPFFYITIGFSDATHLEVTFAMRELFIRWINMEAVSGERWQLRDN